MRHPRMKECEAPTARLGLRGRATLLVLAGVAAMALVVSCSTPDGLLADLKSTHGHHHGTTTDTVQLSWNADAGSTLAGYKLYMRTSSGTYGTPTTLGLVTTTNVSTLVRGTTYYFALTAFNNGGQESAKTAELSYLAP
jgi:Fibronectin type III domain